jgi:hypothetical protein
MKEWRSTRYMEAVGWKEVDRRGKYGGRYTRGGGRKEVVSGWRQERRR